jgi:hypothetical protein
MVSGTPTVYIDGKWDPSRDRYKKLISKKWTTGVEDSELGFFDNLKKKIKRIFE